MAAEGEGRLPEWGALGGVICKGLLLFSIDQSVTFTTEAAN